MIRKIQPNDRTTNTNEIAAMATTEPGEVEDITSWNKLSATNGQDEVIKQQPDQVANGERDILLSEVLLARLRNGSEEPAAEKTELTEHYNGLGQ